MDIVVFLWKIKTKEVDQSLKMKMVLTDAMVDLINDALTLQGKIVNKIDVNGIQEVIRDFLGKYLFVLINLLLMTVARIVRIQK